MTDNITPLNTRQRPVENIVDHLESLLADAKEGKVRGFFYGTVEGNGGTTWGHSVDIEGGENLRLLKLLLHPSGEIDFLIRQRLRENYTSTPLGEEEEDE